MNKQTVDLQKMLMTALMMSVIMVLTYTIRIPVPATHGYVHLGDAGIFVAVMLLGWRYGAIAAAFGSALSDLLGGFAYFVPLTFLAKGLMALLMGLFLERAFKKKNRHSMLISVIGMIIGGVVEVAGYFFGEVLMYGNWLVPVPEIGMNTVQFVVGMFLAWLLSSALCRGSVAKLFAYNINETNSKKK